MRNERTTHNKSPDLLKTFADKDKTILLALLSEYAEKERHSSDQIWSIGAVFIPLSISGVVLGLDDKFRTLGVAIFSIILIWVWYMISAGLRSMIDVDWGIYAAIESSLLKLKPPRLKQGLREIALIDIKKPFSVGKVRLLIPIIITVAWVFIVVLTFVLP